MTDNLQMGVRTRRLARAVLGCAAICATASARADDYVLAAGETDAFAFAGGTVTNFTSMTVAGSLGITGNGWIKTPTLNLDGGTLTVIGLGLIALGLLLIFLCIPGWAWAAMGGAALIVVGWLLIRAEKGGR